MPAIPPKRPRGTRSSKRSSSRKDATIPSQCRRRHIPQPRPPRGRTARPVAGRLLEASPPTNKKRRSPEQPALSFLSFANAFLALFARGSSRTTSGTVRTCERLVGKARPPWSGNLSRSGRSPTPADACPRTRAHLTWEGYRRARTLTLACARRARCWCAASSRPCQCRSHLRGRPRARTSPPRAAPRRARRSAGFRRPRQASRRPEVP